MGQLSDHLKHARKNASYLSPDIQNELIHLAGLDIKEAILDRAQSSKWLSILADECTDVATHEQMSICIRFVDEESSEPIIREEFLGFVKLDRADAVSISEAIIGFLKENNLDMNNLRGQGYDGASVMAGRVCDVSTKICQLQPKALYQHCRAHNLNLVISSSCKQVPDIRNLFDSIGSLTWFLGASAKGKAIIQRYLLSDDISSLILEDNEEELPVSDELLKASVKNKSLNFVRLDGQLV